MSICRTSDERAYLSGAMSETGMRLAQEAILMQYGYNISQIEDLSSLRKRKYWLCSLIITFSQAVT